MNQTKNEAFSQMKQTVPRESSPVYSDSTHLKKYIDRLSALAMIGKITPEVIHDINNYLTGILGYAELLSMKKIEDDSIKNGLKNISISAEKCKVLLANILSLSRRESSFIRFGDVNEIIEKTIELRRCALRHQQIELVMDLGNKIPALAVEGVKLQKALLNLMFMAEAALEQRTEERKIALKTIFDSLTNTVVITISANSFGISYDRLVRIFELFPAEEPIEPENGLLLKEAMQWISEMEGALKIETKTGEGLDFAVFFPVKTRD
jgi:C4-dicarboxylate-specific signal transduction histidine kinase